MVDLNKPLDGFGLMAVVETIKGWLRKKQDADSAITMEQVNAAIQGKSGFPSGGIIIWSGAADNIPEGWALCDGTNGTPDLRGRFVLGQSNSHTIGSKGGEETHVLSVSEMPKHKHPLMYPTKLKLSSSGTLYPLCLFAVYESPNGSEFGGGSGVTTTSGLMEISAANNVYSGTKKYDFVYSGETGNSYAHNNMPPYYALCYIMKL